MYTKQKTYSRSCRHPCGVKWYTLVCRHGRRRKNSRNFPEFSFFFFFLATVLRKKKNAVVSRFKICCNLRVFPAKSLFLNFRVHKKCFFLSLKPVCSGQCTAHGTLHTGQYTQLFAHCILQDCASMWVSKQCNFYSKY